MNAEGEDGNGVTGQDGNQMVVRSSAVLSIGEVYLENGGGVEGNGEGEV